MRRCPVAVFVYFLRPFSPVLGVGRCLHSRTFFWSSEPFYVRMPFLTTTNDVYVGTQTFQPKVRPATFTPQQALGHLYRMLNISTNCLFLLFFPNLGRLVAVYISIKIYFLFIGRPYTSIEKSWYRPTYHDFSI